LAVHLGKHSGSFIRLSGESSLAFQILHRLLLRNFDKHRRLNEEQLLSMFAHTLRQLCLLGSNHDKSHAALVWMPGETAIFPI
jgi:hypothetical protein